MSDRLFYLRCALYLLGMGLIGLGLMLMAK